MLDRHLIATGFVQQFIFPFAALSIAIIGYSRSAMIPINVISAVYPIGLLFLVIYPILESVGRRRDPKTYIATIRGARYGTMAVAAVSILFFLVLSELFEEHT